MSEEQNPAGEQAQQQFELQKIYLKDASFETPNSPACFTQEWQPNINIQLNTDAKGIADKQYEVVLSITVTATNEDKTAFLVEIQQAGIFTISGFEDEQLRGMLGSFCPNILFPYARETISDMSTRGGFPQLLLNPVNFDALYAEHLKQEADQAAEKPTAH